MKEYREKETGPRRALLERREAVYLLVLLAFTLYSMHQADTIRLGTRFRPYPFLVWNLFLAWVPVAFQLLLAWAHRLPAGGLRLFLVLAFGAGWLFFYPNAPYLVTDLLHVFAHYPFNPESYFWRDQRFWDHLFAVLLPALIGLVVGSYSLMAVHRLVRRSSGPVRGWLFALAVLAVSSLGIYLGRFLRLNSWDLVFSPRYLWSVVAEALEPSKLPLVASFCKGMFVIMTFTYIGLVFLSSGRSQEEK
ncbi:DUF1361 domain-containing protein [Gorillibacterium sp. sgz500922]|uniref:DUF1361 domain-containing protein n=1 Tax=Gorillibacterium sp. sgz500922 TaxID=3446694 RepID=UPI003F66C59E